MINGRLPSCSGNHDEGKGSESWQARKSMLGISAKPKNMEISLRAGRAAVAGVTV